jgi:hypothetical protein
MKFMYFCLDLHHLVEIETNKEITEKRVTR